MANDGIFDEETTEAIGETVENGEGIGVLAPAYAANKAGQDPKTGRFLPGNAIGAAGRPAKSREDAVLRLMRKQIDPQVIVDTVLDLVEDSSSWRAREAGVRLYLAYMVGMPVQRSVTATTRLESLLNKIGEMDEEEFVEVEQAIRSTD
jgi:hypothetical protein